MFLFTCEYLPVNFTHPITHPDMFPSPTLLYAMHAIFVFDVAAYLKSDDKQNSKQVYLTNSYAS